MKNIELEILMKGAKKILKFVPSFYVLPSAMKSSKTDEGFEDFSGYNVLYSLTGMLGTAIIAGVLGDKIIPESHESYTLIPLFGGLITNLFSGVREHANYLRKREQNEKQSHLLYER